MKPLRYNYSTDIMVPEGEAHGKFMLRTVLDRGWGISILRETRLRRLQQHFRVVTLVHLYEGVPSESLADDLLTARNMAP